MQISRFTLFIHRLEVEADIGIHDFERERRQRVAISITVEIDPAELPAADDIGQTFDYDWIRSQIRALCESRRFDLQETLARNILDIIATRGEIRKVTVETSKPDVYPDAAAVGCRLEAQR